MPVGASVLLVPLRIAVRRIKQFHRVLLPSQSLKNVYTRNLLQPSEENLLGFGGSFMRQSSVKDIGGFRFMES